MEETSRQIRDRRQKEFDAKMVQGTTVDMGVVFPWGLIKINQQKLDLEWLRRELRKANDLIDKLERYTGQC